MARGKKGPDGLTDKQREYARLRAQGQSQIDAYTGAGYGSGSSHHTRERNAQRLEEIDSIREHIAHLQQMADQGCIMTTEQRKCALIEIYRDSTAPVRDRLKAIDLLNRMSGDYVEKKEVAVSGLTRSDRAEAMLETLESLKTAWKA